MPHTQQLSILLPDEVAQMIKSKVADGSYASESDVVLEGLQVLQERDGAVERWLMTEVSSAYDAHKAQPDRAEALDDVIRQLETDGFQSRGERH